MTTHHDDAPAEITAGALLSELVHHALGHMTRGHRHGGKRL